MRRRLLGVTVALAALLAGCVVFTGGTDGYQLVDAGTCTSAADCSGSDVCCATLTSSSSATATCGPSPCAGLSVQICKASTECSGGTCITQSCPVDGGSVPVQACSLVPTCIATPGDAAAPGD